MFLSLAAAALLAAAPAADAPQDGKLYQLKAAHSGKALAPNADGTGVEQRELKADDDAQRWKFVKSGEFYRVLHVKSGKAVEAPEAAEDLAAVGLADGKSKETDRQLWKLTKGTKGYTLKSKSADKVLDVEGVSGDDGAKVILYGAKDGEEDGNQSFELVPVDGK